MTSEEINTPHKHAPGHAELAALSKDEQKKITGEIVVQGPFGKNAIRLFQNGYIAVDGLFRKNSPERLLKIEGRADVQKKTGLGRAAAAIITGGANLMLSPNTRGNAYLLIETDKQLYTLESEMVSSSEVKLVHTLLMHAPKGGNESVVDSPDVSEQLSKLAELRDSGALSEEEFTAAKARVLGA
jgi:hypothetical protein